MKKISIGCCCYNEKDNIIDMYNALTNALTMLPEYEYEIIFSDNKSTDGSREILKGLAKKDKNVKVILNQVNYGPSLSGINVMRHASGDALIILPCDFQDPPEMIVDFVKGWEEGYDIVWGQKTSGEENKIKYLCRKVFYSVIDFFADKKQLYQVTGFGLMDKKVIDIILPIRISDPQKSLRHVVIGFGFRIKLLPYKQKKRKSGKSSYNLYRYLDFAIKSLVNTSYKPLRIITIMGCINIFISLIFLIVCFVLLLHFKNIISIISLGQAFCYFGLSLTHFFIGIIGEYIKSVLNKVSYPTEVIEEEVINFD